MEPIFKEGDYIINHSSRDIAIVKGVTKKGYYEFKAYYSSMLNELKDVSDPKHNLQIHYQKFFEPCGEDERQKIDALIINQNKKL